MEIMEFFPLMHIWFFHHSHLVYLENWFMKCMVKLDIVSVEILTNIICVPVARIFRKYMRILWYMLFQPLTKYLFLKIVKIHMKTSEPESLFHKVQVSSLHFYWKRYSHSGVFLSIFIRFSLNASRRLHSQVLLSVYYGF